MVARKDSRKALSEARQATLLLCFSCCASLFMSFCFSHSLIRLPQFGLMQSHADAGRDAASQQHHVSAIEQTSEASDSLALFQARQATLLLCFSCCASLFMSFSFSHSHSGCSLIRLPQFGLMQSNAKCKYHQHEQKRVCVRERMRNIHKLVMSSH